MSKAEFLGKLLVFMKWLTSDAMKKVQRPLTDVGLRTLDFGLWTVLFSQFLGNFIRAEDIAQHFQHAPRIN